MSNASRLLRCGSAILLALGVIVFHPSRTAAQAGGLAGPPPSTHARQILADARNGRGIAELIEETSPSTRQGFAKPYAVVRVDDRPTGAVTPPIVGPSDRART